MVLTDLYWIVKVNIHSALQPKVIHQYFFFFITYEQKTRCNATIAQRRDSAEICNETLGITICLRCSALTPNYCCYL